jgi:hypothetical protein
MAVLELHKLIVHADGKLFQRVIADNHVSIQFREF